MRRFVLDLPQGEDPPATGSKIATARKLYRILGVDPVDSKIWPNRWKLSLDEIGPRPEADLDDDTIGTKLYQRGERPEDAFGPWRDDEEGAI